jgi:hypothetical protein
MKLLGCIPRQKYELYNIKIYIGGIGYEKVGGISLTQIYSGGLRHTLMKLGVL